MTWDDARIAQERAICERATDAPWLQPRPFILFKPNTPTPTESPENWLATFDSPHDATFAAHARTVLPEALDEIERLGAENELLTRSLRAMLGYIERHNANPDDLPRSWRKACALVGVTDPYEVKP
jgi:hypothetical protein